MKQDLPGVVRRVAGFIGVDDEDRIETATQHASFAHMAANSAPFEEPWLVAWSIEHLDLPADVRTTKVNRGEVGAHRQQLGSEAAARIDAIWGQVIGEQTGHLTYADLVEDLRVA